MDDKQKVEALEYQHKVLKAQTALLLAAQNDDVIVLNTAAAEYRRALLERKKMRESYGHKD